MEEKLVDAELEASISNGSFEAFSPQCWSQQVTSQEPVAEPQGGTATAHVDDENTAQDADLEASIIDGSFEAFSPLCSSQEPGSQGYSATAEAPTGSTAYPAASVKTTSTDTDTATTRPHADNMATARDASLQPELEVIDLTETVHIYIDLTQD